VHSPGVRGRCIASLEVGLYNVDSSHQEMEVTIQHCLTKSDGGKPPSIEELSALEINDIRSFLIFHLDWDPGASPEIEESGVKIVEIEFVDDGITSCLMLCPNRVHDCIEGDPAPLIRYTLDRDVDAEEFKRCVWQSSMIYQPASRLENGDTPYYAEDHNGYTHVVDSKSISSKPKASGAFAGKVYAFPGGVEPYDGVDFNATEFAMAPK